MSGKTKLKAGCGIFMVFSAGFLCGVIALFAVLVRVIPLSEGWKDEDSKEFVMKHLANRLKLSEEQVDLVQPIVSDGLDERFRHRETYVRADIRITRDTMDSILPHLSHEQQDKAERMFREWEKGKRRFLGDAVKASGEGEEKEEDEGDRTRDESS